MNQFLASVNIYLFLLSIACGVILIVWTIKELKNINNKDVSIGFVLVLIGNIYHMTCDLRYILPQHHHKIVDITYPEYTMSHISIPLTIFFICYLYLRK